jgi:hypothetical protein
MHGWPGLVTPDVQGLQAQHQQADEEQRLLAVSVQMISRIQGRIGMMRRDPLEYVR